MRGDMVAVLVSVFFFNDTATTEIYTLSLHDALPISPRPRRRPPPPLAPSPPAATPRRDRKSTRLNSSHEWISYAVFCLKKKNILLLCFFLLFLLILLFLLLLLLLLLLDLLLLVFLFVPFVACLVFVFFF